MGQNTVSNLLERQVALANIQPLSTTDVFRSMFPEAAQCRDWPYSPSRPRPSSLQHWVALLLFGKATGAEGPDTAARLRGNGELPFLWSEHRPAIEKTSATEGN